MSACTGVVDYFHGTESEQYSFYRIPKMLFTAECFKGLSCEAKVLYGLMLDRMCLSIKNRWFDEEDKVYIVFTVEEITELMDCGTQKAVKLMKELDVDKGIGLIEKRRLGMGKPNVIYVKNFMVKEETSVPEKEESSDNGEIEEITVKPESGNDDWQEAIVVKDAVQVSSALRCVDNENHASGELERLLESQLQNGENHNSGTAESMVWKSLEGKFTDNSYQHSKITETSISEATNSQFQNDENHNSKIVKTTIHEFPKSPPNDTESNDTDISQTDSINPYLSDVTGEMGRYRDVIRKNISYRYLLSDEECSGAELDELVEMMVDVMMMPDNAFLRIAGVERSAALVKERFMKLEQSHIEYVLSCLHGNTSKVGNIRAYLLTALYNAVLTIDNYYRVEMNHDMYSGR